MARQPLSDEDAWLSGTESRAGQRVVPREPSVAKTGRPTPPKNLSQEELAEWRRICRLLYERSTLTKADGPLLELYVRSRSRWLLVLADIEKHGAVVESTWVGQDGVERSKLVENPASKIAARLEASMRALLKELGATPASREKARPATRKEGKGECPEGSMGRYEQQRREHPEQFEEPQEQSDEHDDGE